MEYRSFREGTQVRDIPVSHGSTIKECVKRTRAYFSSGMYREVDTEFLVMDSKGQTVWRSSEDE